MEKRGGTEPGETGYGEELCDPEVQLGSDVDYCSRQHPTTLLVTPSF